MKYYPRANREEHCLRNTCTTSHRVAKSTTRYQSAGTLRDKEDSPKRFAEEILLFCLISLHLPVFERKLTSDFGVLPRFQYGELRSDSIIVIIRQNVCVYIARKSSECSDLSCRCVGLDVENLTRLLHGMLCRAS